MTKGRRCRIDGGLISYCAAMAGALNFHCCIQAQTLFSAIVRVSNRAIKAAIGHGSFRHENCKTESAFVKYSTCIFTDAALRLNADFETAVRKTPDDKRSNAERDACFRSRKTFGDKLAGFSGDWHWRLCRRRPNLTPSV